MLRWRCIPDARELDIDASSQTDWAYVNLARGRVVSVSDPATSSAWDLAFKRFSKLNGGASGAGGAEAVVVKDAAQEGRAARPCWSARSTT